GTGRGRGGEFGYEARSRYGSRVDQYFWIREHRSFRLGHWIFGATLRVATGICLPHCRSTRRLGSVRGRTAGEGAWVVGSQVVGGSAIVNERRKSRVYR